MESVRIAALREEDWEILKAIRLKALQSDPGVFSSNYADEAKYEDYKWRSMLQEKNVQIFALFDKDKAIGMTGVAIDRGDPSGQRAVLWGSWLEPAYRKQGLSVLMYEARIDWARQHPVCRTVIVSHRASNANSERANQKHGFVFTHAVTKTWPDGGVEDDVFYELRVKSPAAAPLPP
jgi:RimJ/RimL family protein N-acetyltransferase